MDRQNIERTVIYTLIIILSAALIAGSVALILQITRDPSVDDGTPKQTSGSGEADVTNPPQKNPPETNTQTDETTGSGEPGESGGETTPTVTLPPVTAPETDPVHVTTYESSKKMYALSNVNVRESYTTDSVILGMFYKSEEVTVTGETDNGWFVVKFNGHTGYIRSDLLTEDQESSKIVITTYTAAKTMYAKSEVNFREGPTTNSKSFGLIPAGTAVSVIGETDNRWYQVVYDGKTAFIKSDFLSQTKPDVSGDNDA